MQEGSYPCQKCPQGARLHCARYRVDPARWTLQRKESGVLEVTHLRTSVGLRYVHISRHLFLGVELVMERGRFVECGGRLSLGDERERECRAVHRTREDRILMIKHTQRDSFGVGMCPELSLGHVCLCFSSDLVCSLLSLLVNSLTLIRQ